MVEKAQGASAAPERTDLDAAELRDELERTRAALARAEQEVLELRAQRSATMARLEREAYWFERADVDPDKWLSRGPVRFALGIARALRRSWRRLRGRS
jgi:hypothetical protein